MQHHTLGLLQRDSTCTMRPAQGTHNLYKEPEVFRPERFMPGGEYDGFEEADRLFMFVPHPAWDNYNVMRPPFINLIFNVNFSMSTRKN